MHLQSGQVEHLNLGELKSVRLIPAPADGGRPGSEKDTCTALVQATAEAINDSAVKGLL